MADRQCPQKMPYVMNVEPGEYAWCRCGRSQNQPYCDGSHQGTGISPERVTIESEQRVAWCGCKRSNNEPFCDGTHATLVD